MERDYRDPAVIAQERYDAYLKSLQPQKCEWPGHNEAMDEAGFCAVCQQGTVDREWALRTGNEEMLEDL